MWNNVTAFVVPLKDCAHCLLVFRLCCVLLWPYAALSPWEEEPANNIETDGMPASRPPSKWLWCDSNCVIIWHHTRYLPLIPTLQVYPTHCSDVIISAMASQITSLTIVYSTVYSDADQRKHQSSASLAFVGGIHRWPVNSPHKGPVTRKIFPFDDVIMWH